ncbi:MAG TPA: type IV secretion system protein VirB4, partial [Burkholderiaceae bacterium]|nr:type IV secretion system protein VirB4 [Burkholderiaceae bacterium]
MRSYAELLPWFRQIAPGLVLNLDGTLLALFEYDGLPAESASSAEVDSVIETLEIALRGLDERNCIWTFLDKRRHRYSNRRPLANLVADGVDEAWCRALDDGSLAVVRTRLALSFQFARGSGGFFDDIGARVMEHRERFATALAKVACQRLSRPAELERMQGRVTAAVKAFELQLAAFESTLANRLKIRRVQGPALCAELSNRANPASPRASVSLPPGDLYFLNTLLPTDTPRR